MSDDIKDCPSCCNDDGNVYGGPAQHRWVKCGCCEMRGPVSGKWDDTDAIRMWNELPRKVELTGDYTELLVPVPDYPNVEQLKDAVEHVEGANMPSGLATALMQKVADHIEGAIDQIKAHEVNEGIRQSRIEDLESELKTYPGALAEKLHAAVVERDEWKVKAEGLEADLLESEGLAKEWSDRAYAAEDKQRTRDICDSLQRESDYRATWTDADREPAGPDEDENSSYTGPVTNPTREQFAMMLIQSERSGRELQTQYEGSPTWHEFGMVSPLALRLAPVMRYYWLMTTGLWLERDDAPASDDSDVVRYFSEEVSEMRSKSHE